MTEDWHCSDSSRNYGDSSNHKESSKYEFSAGLKVDPVSAFLFSIRFVSEKGSGFLYFFISLYSKIQGPSLTDEFPILITVEEIIDSLVLFYIFLFNLPTMIFKPAVFSIKYYSYRVNWKCFMSIANLSGGRFLFLMQPHMVSTRMYHHNCCADKIWLRLVVVGCASLTCPRLFSTLNFPNFTK